MTRTTMTRTTTPATSLRLSVNPIACSAYGYCAELLPELVTLDEWGYPVVDGTPVPAHLAALARKAADSCPRRAVHLVAADEPSAVRR